MVVGHGRGVGVVCGARRRMRRIAARAKQSIVVIAKDNGRLRYDIGRRVFIEKLDGLYTIRYSTSSSYYHNVALRHARQALWRDYTRYGVCFMSTQYDTVVLRDGNLHVLLLDVPSCARTWHHDAIRHDWNPDTVIEWLIERLNVIDWLK